jgi:hypothetical protein
MRDEYTIESKINAYHIEVVHIESNIYKEKVKIEIEKMP